MFKESTDGPRLVSDEDITNIQKKYNIVYFDDARKQFGNTEELPEYIKKTIKSHSTVFDYKEKIPIYKDIVEKPIDKDCTDRTIDGIRICVLPKGTVLYKGMRYFYDPECDARFQGDDQPTWYGNLKTASAYAQTYHGGLNVYKVTKDIKLMYTSSYENLLRVFHAVQNKEDKDVICLKFGVGCEFVDQIELVMKANRWKDDIWLQKTNRFPEIGYSGKIRNYGMGRNDRYFIEVLRKVVGKDIDGWISPKLVSPFYSHGLSGEILLFNQKKIGRDTDNKYDWTNWQKYLPFKVPRCDVFELTNSASQKNNNFQMITFYLNSYPKDLSVRESGGFKIMSFNVHFLESLNARDDVNKCYAEFLNLVKTVNPDVAGIQEFPSSHLSKLHKDLKGWSVYSADNGSRIGSSHKLLCLMITKLPVVKTKTVIGFEGKKQRNSIFALIKYQDKVVKVAVTHLPIGRRYKTMNYAKEVEKTYYSNYKFRKSVLKKLLGYRPKILIGDFNFAPHDKETELIKGTDYEKSFRTLEEEVNYTTPFRTTVDYVLVRTQRALKYQTIKYPYSDHLPLLCTIVSK